MRLLDKSNPEQSKDSDNSKKADIVTHKAAAAERPSGDSDTLLESIVAEEKRLCSHGPSSDTLT